MKSANRRQLWFSSRHAVWITRTRSQLAAWWHAAVCMSSCRRSSPSSARAWCPHWPWAGHHRRVWRRAAGGHFILYVIIHLRAGMYSAFDYSCIARTCFCPSAYYVYKIKIEPNFHSFAASIPVRRAHFRPMRISSHQSCKSHSMQKLSMQVY